MSEPEKVTPDQLADLAVKRAFDLLSGPSDDLPAHVLAQILTSAARMSERQAPEGGPEQTDTIFEAIEALPPERAADLLRAEIERIERAAAEYRDRLRALETPTQEEQPDGEEEDSRGA